MGVFGLKGHVKVRPLTDFWERFEPGVTLRLDGSELMVEDASEHQGKLLLKLEGIDDPDSARAVQFHYLEGATDFVPELHDDEFMTEDLIGLRVSTVAGEDLGVVTDVIPTPAHDVIAVGDILIPAVKQFVKQVDLQAGRMVVELIEGMRTTE